MERKNVLLIQSDQHNPRFMGCAGDQRISTPALDSLADRGTRFDNAYCPSPICVPSRASLATGRYPHQTRNWDNAAPYIGTEADSWAHRLNDAGVHVTTIGKLHFRKIGDPNGFDDQRIPMHVLNGVGDLYPLLRGDAPPKEASRLIVDAAGPGESEYTNYDRQIADAARRWLEEEASQHEGGWALYVSFVCPHFPLIVPQEFFDMYDTEDIPMPVNWARDMWPSHPAVESLRRLENLDTPFDEEAIRRAVVAYHGMVSFLDQQVGRVLEALERSGLMDDTYVMYTSDHGDMVGQHGLWSKHTMYEGSVGVPMIVAGPGVPAGHVVGVNSSIVDIFPTVLAMSSVAQEPEDEDLPGVSLLDLVEGFEGDRVAFSEYHANYSANASFMIKEGNFKYIYHVGSSPQLFDLADDPDELSDLAPTADEETLSHFERLLRDIVDPESADAEAKRHGTARIDSAGGRDAVLSAGIKVPYSPPPLAYVGPTAADSL